MQVLVVDEDEELAGFVANGLQELGHKVRAVRDGDSALAALVEGQFDVVVLDRLLPGAEGLAILREAREAGCQTPILIMSTLGSVEDRVAGLEAGADDYLVKPFAFAELAARVSALGRRPLQIVAVDRLSFADIEMNLARRTVARGGRPVDLQPREFSLLEQLLRSPDRVVTRAILLDRVWSFGFDPHTNIVETHMSRLRTKLNLGFDHNAIRTVRGAGYILEPAAG